MGAISASADAPVTTLCARAYRVPTDAPEADGTLTWDSTTVVVVQASAEQHTGLGWSYAPAAAAAFVEELLHPVAVGSCALDVTAVHDRMARAVRNAGRGGVAACAISAVDTALWDLKARLLEVPLHRLLGAVRDVVPVYGSGGFTSLDYPTLEGQLRGWVEAGIPRVKIKIGESWGTCVARDEDRVRFSRGVIGDDTALFVDANGAYTASQAVAVWDRLADVGVSWFEEPVTSQDLDGLRTVRERIGADVAAGEYSWELEDAARLCRAGAVDCLQIDVTRCGGITSWQRISALAQSHHLSVSAHCAPALHLAVAAATPGLRHIEYFADHVRLESLLFEGVRTPEGGSIEPGMDPGAGLSLRVSDAEPYRVR